MMSYWITGLPKQSLYVSHVGEKSLLHFGDEIQMPETTKKVVGVFNINTWHVTWDSGKKEAKWVIFVLQRPRLLWTNAHNKSICGIFSSYKEIQQSDHTFVLHDLLTRGYRIQANAVCVCLFCCLTQLLCCWWSCLYWLCVWARECLRVFALGSSPFWFIGLLMDREAQEEQER